MAIIANTFTTYNAGANAKDVTNFVTNVSPTDTPFYSMIKDTRAYARLHEVVQDELESASDSGAVEGGKFSFKEVKPRSYESNLCQIFTNMVMVSGTQEAVAKDGGIVSEIAYQVKKAHKEIANDIEKAFIVGTSATGGTAAARELKGLAQIVTTNTATADLTGNTWVGTAAANIAAFEELFNDLAQMAFDTGQTMDTVLVGGKVKRRIAKMTGSDNRRNIEAEKRTLINRIDIYESDFGSMNCILDRYVTDDLLLMVAIDGFKTAYLRRIKQSSVPVAADGSAFAVIGELTLEAASEKYGAKITAS